MVTDGALVDGPGLTIVTVGESHFSQTVVAGSSSVTVTVAGSGETVTTVVVSSVLTTVTCAEKAEDADAPAPPSTGTTEYVGLLARALMTWPL